MPVVGARPRLKYRGNIRHDLVQIRNFCNRILKQNINAKGAPFLTDQQVTDFTNAQADCVALLAEKT